MHYDFQLVLESEKAIDRFAGIRAEVLLLGGSESPAYLKFALGELAKLFPKARRVELPGLNHGASGNSDRRGKPEVVAKELLKFYE
jgi:hypothetical protein